MAKVSKHPKKVITEEQFNEAYHNRDNQNIINSVLKKYSSILDGDTLKSCGLNALWRCLASHSYEYKTKFTSSLYKFTKWECERERLKIHKKSKKPKPKVVYTDVAEHLIQPSTDEGREPSILDDIDDILSSEHASIVRMKFVEDRTLEEIGRHFGYTKEAARQKLKVALKTLGQVYKQLRIG